MKRASPYLSLLSFVVGLVLFLYLLASTGVGPIFERMQLVGWGFLGMILLAGARNGIRAIAWRHCLNQDDHPPSLFQLFGLRLVGQAFADITPAGPLLGESMKVWAGSSYMTAGATASSVAIEALVYVLANALYISAGVAFLVFDIVAPERFQAEAVGIVCLLLFSILGLALVIGRREQLLGAILDWLRLRGVRGSYLERYERGIRNFEKRIHEFFRTRRKTFLIVLILELSASLTGIAEAYLVLSLTTGHASILASYLADAAIRVAHLMFFVPLGVGTEEASAGATLAALGYTLSDGVSLAVIRKGRTIFWDAIGLLLAAKWSVSRSRIQASTDGPRDSRDSLIVSTVDSGLTEGVNQAIIDAHQSGIVAGASLMANGKALPMQSAGRFDHDAR